MTVKPVRDPVDLGLGDDVGLSAAWAHVGKVMDEAVNQVVTINIDGVRHGAGRINVGQLVKAPSPRVTTGEVLDESA